MEEPTWTSLSAEIKRGIEHWIAHNDKRKVRLFLSKADSLRILRLRVWAFRYKLTIGEILDLIMPALRKGIRISGHRKVGLGIRIATVAGDAAEAILRDRLVEKYPDGANVSAWKDERRDEQLQAERDEDLDGVQTTAKKLKTLLDLDGDVEKFAAAYKARILELRRGQKPERWRRRKRYRDNPWL